jgi:hypothetical protein
MACGIQVPLITKNGRLKKLYGDAYIEQLVQLALIGMESENPFQTLGLGEWMIFGINDGMTTGQIKEKVISIFDLFEADQLAKLKSEDESIQFKRGDEGELYMSVEYVNMETQEGKSIEVPIPPVGD